MEKSEPVDVLAVDVLAVDLWTQRAKKRMEDSDIVENLIAEGKMDAYKIEDYKYVAGKARELGWSMGRLQNAISLANVIDVVRERQEVQ
jgi:hypothetical protein